MSRRRRDAEPSAAEVRRLVTHAAGRGVTLDRASAREIARMGPRVGMRKLEGVLRLIGAARDEGRRLSARRALDHIDRSGGDPEEAFRRMLTGGVELRPGVADTVRYAAYRGVVFAPSTVYERLRTEGESATREHIDQLGAVMDAAAELGFACSQSLAAQWLRDAGGNAAGAVAELRAGHRRRQDRQNAPCRVVVPPHDPRLRSNALAGCGCSRCQDRLVAQMEPYIAKMISGSRFARLDREEARCMAHLEVMESLEKWRGGSNFMGWMAKRFDRQMQKLQKEQGLEESRTVSLDAPAVLADDGGGRLVPLEERIPDRTCDVLTIVILRERLAEWALGGRQALAERGEEYLAALHDQALALLEGGAQRI